VQRGLRAQLLTTYPQLTPYIDEILPKKSQVDALKLPAELRVTLYALDSVPLFYQHMNDALVPHLKLVHRFPQGFKKVRCDRGAIRFVLGGANMAVPGLTSKGGWLPGEEEGEGDDAEAMQVQKGDVVVVEAEGKEEACMVGVLKMGGKEMREVGKGIAIEGGHYLGDGLWRLDLG
jgi:malignant T-cell-amplified sequence